MAGSRAGDRMGRSPKDAGHDINYVALTGLLHGIGPKERPSLRPTISATMRAAAMMLAFGMVSALLAVREGADGQVVDAAMSDGAAADRGHDLRPARRGPVEERARGEPLDGGSETYGIYRCSDGKFLAVGAIEPQFQQALFKGLALRPGQAGKTSPQ